MNKVNRNLIIIETLLYLQIEDRSRFWSKQSPDFPINSANVVDKIT